MFSQLAIFVSGILGVTSPLHLAQIRKYTVTSSCISIKEMILDYSREYLNEAFTSVSLKCNNTCSILYFSTVVLLCGLLLFPLCVGSSSKAKLDNTL